MDSSMLPPWAHTVLEENHAFVNTLLTERRVDSSDLSQQQNNFRLLADSSDLKFLVPRLCNREELVASDRNNGLNVSVFIPDGLRMQLLMTISDDSADVNLTGNEAELTQIFSCIKEGDYVGIWMFQHFINNDGETKICFIIVKQNDTFLFYFSGSSDD